MLQLLRQYPVYLLLAYGVLYTLKYNTIDLSMPAIMVLCSYIVCEGFTAA